MDIDKLLETLERDEAEMLAAEAKQGHGGKKAAVSIQEEEAIPKEDPDTGLCACSLEDVERIRNLEEGEEAAVAGTRFWKIGGVAVSLGSINSICTRAVDELSESWLLACYPRASMDSSKHLPEYVQGKPLGNCMVDGATIRVVYSSRRSMEEIESNFDFDKFKKALKRTVRECADSGIAITEVGPEGVAYVSSTKMDVVAVDMIMQYAVFGELFLA